MFFVGATGQLLTLILTVCLPFVFLFSAQPKTEMLNDSLLINNQELHQQFSSIENISVDHQIETIENIMVSLPDLEESIFKKLPPDYTHIKWKSVHLKSSGNKAPPASSGNVC